MRVVAGAVLVLVLCALLPFVHAQIRPPARPHNYDCALKQLAYNRSLALLAGSSNADAGAWPQLIHDALFLGQCSEAAAAAATASTSTARRTFRERVRQARATPPPEQRCMTVFVSPSGDDTHGDGSAAHPFASLQRALAVTASMPAHGSGSAPSSLEILMQPGHYFVANTVYVGPQPLPVTIRAADPVRRPIISGGMRLTNLTFTAAGDPSLPPTTLVTTLPPQVDLSNAAKGLSVFVDHEAYVAARWPNANPVYDLWPAGYVDGPIEYAPAHHPGPHEIPVSVQAATLPFPSVYQTYEHTLVDPRQWHVGRGVGGATLPPSATPPANLTGGIAVNWDGNNHPGYRDQWMNYGYFITKQSDPNTKASAEQATPSSDPDSPSSSSSSLRSSSSVSSSSSSSSPTSSSSSSSSSPSSSSATLTSTSKGRPASGGHTLTFGAGGWQGTNPDSGDKYRQLYVYNARGALDAPGEYWIDASARQLFLIPNNTAINTTTTITIAQQATVLSVSGTARRPVRNLTLRDLVFTATRPTFMEEYEQPYSNTAGWSFARHAAVEMEGVEDSAVVACSFRWLGGNGLLLSGRANNVSVLDSEFAFLGDSAILALGRPRLAAGVWPDFPNATTVQRCLFHDLGLVGKQVAAYSQYMAAHTTLARNVAFNLPRAAVNWGDGFRGGNVLTASVFFACVRESADHGAFNSWAREPMLYVDEASGGNVAVVPRTNTISKMLILGAGGTLSNLDHDDGSLLYNDTDNVLAYAPAKSYLGSQKTATRSLFLFPDLAVMQHTCYMSDGAFNSTFGEQYTHNTCMLFNATTAPVASMPVCNQTALSACTASNNNRYFVSTDASHPTPVWRVGHEALHLPGMQKLGLEHNSTVVSGFPSPSEVVAMAKAVLDM